MKDKQLTVRMETGRTGKRAVGMTTVEGDNGSKIAAEEQKH